MDYLTVALILIGIGVLLLSVEILMPTGGILVAGALLFFALGVGTILYYGTMMEAVVAIGGLAVGLPAAAFAATSAWRRMSLDTVLEETAAPDSGPRRDRRSEGPYWQDRLPNAPVRHRRVRRQAGGRDD
jgi:hypothetical protein